MASVCRTVGERTSAGPQDRHGHRIRDRLPLSRAPPMTALKKSASVRARTHRQSHRDHHGRDRDRDTPAVQRNHDGLRLHDHAY